MSEFKSLSDYIIEIPDEEGIWNGDEACKTDKVREFIQLVNEDVDNASSQELINIHIVKRILDKRAGPALTDSKVEG